MNIANADVTPGGIFVAAEREYGILPFWFWNGRMTREDMLSQIRQFSEKGLAGFIIHARFGIREAAGYLTMTDDTATRDNDEDCMSAFWYFVEV